MIDSPDALSLDKFSATPPPIFDKWFDEDIAYDIPSVLSSTDSKKHDTISPALFLPAFKKVGVAGWNSCFTILSAKFKAKSLSPFPSVKATINTLSLYVSNISFPSLLFNA